MSLSILLLNIFFFIVLQLELFLIYIINLFSFLEFRRYLEISFTCLSVTLVTETVSEDSLCVCCQICFSCSCLCFLDLIQKGFLIPWQQQQKKP